jgi:ATP-binding cassette subfamily F protein 3
MIQLTGVAKGFAGRTLFEEADWLIGPSDRVGLVGANGTGKSTLLKILDGAETPDSGAVIRARGVSTGYLPQEGLRLAGRTVFAECLSVFSELQAIEAELEALSRTLAELDPAGEDYREAANRFHALETEFRNRDGYALEAQVGAVLTGLGFSPRDWRRAAEEFSGGWQMRIALAKLLLAKPNLLLLDEPTNHLDLEARNWLEDYLGGYPHAFVLVSHDRYFLDVTVTKVVEIWNRRLHFYAGNYSRYLEQKAARLAQLEAAWRNQQERIQHLEAFINRFRYKASKARQVQSRIKELEKIERIEIPAEEKAIHFTFPQPKPSGRIVAEFCQVAKRYGALTVFEGVSFLIERGERIALIGPNGAGKSTLLKLLAGVEPLTGGEYRLGHNVEPNYFAQDQYKELDAGVRLLDDLAGVAPSWTLTDLRNLLGCFLFSGDDVLKPVAVLSGGERNRYALARLLVAPSNFLLLDEPTNHLDLRAKDVLLEALRSYTGTVVFVSHDRYFIDQLATRIFEVGGGRVEIYPGNYEDYRWRKEQQAVPGEPTSSPEPPPSAAPPPPAGSKAKRLNPILLRQLRRRVEELEEQIARTEAAIAESERELAVFRSAEESRRLAARIAELRAELAGLLAEWERAAEALETQAPA